MNRKLARVFQPSMRLYFIILVIFAIIMIPINWYVALGEGIVILILFVYSQIKLRKQGAQIKEYFEELTNSVETVQKDNSINFPMPMVIFSIDNNNIIWSNESFTKRSEDREHFFERSLTDAVPNLSTKWLVEGKTQCPDIVKMGGRRYQVYGNIVRVQSDMAEQQYLGNIYFSDVTDLAEIREEYYESRMHCALIVIDNYDEFISNLSDKEKSSLLSQIEDKITEWTENSGGLLKKHERDRYLFIFEERCLKRYIDEKFTLLAMAREIVNHRGIAATISIGIGKDSGSLQENYQYAHLGIEMALSRGGDQAVIKNRYSFEFFGGRVTEQEKRTKVKSRVMANSLSTFIQGAQDVYIMGHREADLDALGAAVGVCCIARKLDVRARIVIDLEKNGAQQMIALLMEKDEYRDKFISAEQAVLEVTSASILIVVDTNRPDQVESMSLLTSCNNVAVIDHHRRAADYIENPVINFHEPYASSTCELVTELLQYTVEQSDILRVEAEAIMAGIVMDTKNFTLRTGSRTFEAAAYLRQAGANTTDVKKLMQNDFSETVARYNIIRLARQYKEGIVIAAPETTENRIIAAQAADELLNISGIQASFVVYPTDSAVIISARSIGDINVQVILEQLGGGGNMSTAGAQVKGLTHKQVVIDLLAAIDKYIGDGETEIQEQESTT